MRVVDEIPVTTWYRPNAAALRAAGAPAAGEGVWRREGDAYVGPGNPRPGAGRGYDRRRRFDLKGDADTC